MGYYAKVIAHSIASANNVELATLEVSMPRIVLAEFNTHRMFSRNSASSRAIPVGKMIARVMDDPFIPIYWGKNQKGMQADRELTQTEQEDARATWLAARDKAIYYVREFQSIGVHKQIANRMLEPWLWHTVIVTATEWANFFALRTHKDAQPEIQYAAKLMQQALNASTPTVKGPGDWHLPYITSDDEIAVAERDLSIEDALLKLARISCARCARVSLLSHDGKRDIAADLDLADRLQAPGHMSPFEHAAQVFVYIGRALPFIGNFRAPWQQYRKTLPNEDVFVPT